MEEIDYREALHEFQEAYATLESDFEELKAKLKSYDAKVAELEKQIIRYKGYGEENKLLRLKIKSHNLEVTQYKMRTGRKWYPDFKKHFKSFERIAWRKRGLTPSEIDFMRYLTAGLNSVDFSRAMGWKEQSAHQYRWVIAQKLKQDLNGLDLREWLMSKYGSKIIHPIKLGKLSAAPD